MKTWKVLLEPAYSEVLLLLLLPLHWQNQRDRILLAIKSLINGSNAVRFNA